MIFISMVRKGLTENVTFKQRHEGIKGVNYKTDKKSSPNCGNSRCESPLTGPECVGGGKW